MLFRSEVVEFDSIELAGANLHPSAANQLDDRAGKDFPSEIVPQEEAARRGPAEAEPLLLRGPLGARMDGRGLDREARTIIHEATTLASQCYGSLSFVRQ